LLARGFPHADVTTGKQDLAHCQQDTESDRTPLCRMLARSIGSIGSLEAAGRHLWGRRRPLSRPNNCAASAPEIIWPIFVEGTDANQISTEVANLGEGRTTVEAANRVHAGLEHRRCL
jgi:hypothetical protein